MATGLVGARRARPSRIVMVLALLAPAVLAQLTTSTDAGPDCRLTPAGLTRDDTRYFNPPPSAELLTAVQVFQRNDPNAVFGFFNCEVDWFATTPKRSVPSYALAALRANGLSTLAAEPELVPEPTLGEKRLQDLDANLTRKIPLQHEFDITAPSTGDDRYAGPPRVNAMLPDVRDAVDDDEFDQDPPAAITEERTEPGIDLEPRDDTFESRPQDLVEREGEAAKPILASFLGLHDDVFNIGAVEIAAGLPSLEPVDFAAGRFGRTATFAQRPGGGGLIDGDVNIQFDTNWNVVGISRMIATPQKLHLTGRIAINESSAENIARNAAEEHTGIAAEEWTRTAAESGADPIRRRHMWRISLSAGMENDLDIMLDAETGEVVNISDNVLRYTDAKIRRWAYTNGDRNNAYQVTSTGVYTADDNTLRHDFFYLNNDNRNGGGLIGDFDFPCNEPFSTPSRWRPFAWDTTDGTFQQFRHTHRGDRNFSIWSPAHSSGSFQESHTYHWARWYFLWNKQALLELGVPTKFGGTFPRVTIVTNACIDDIGLARSSKQIATQHNEGEQQYKILQADLCRAGNPSCAPDTYDDSGGNFATCEGNGCVIHPSVVQHEINHFILGSYMGVSSALDCGAGKEGRFVHEGGLGSVVPHAFWNWYYGVGYDPAESRLFTGDAARGRVHANNGDLNRRFDYLCGNNTSGQGPYNAGRVAGQPLWEIYHGKQVEGSTITNMLRPATDTDFLILSYWAADLVDGSTWKDLYEIGNRVMQIIIAYSNASPAQKASVQETWCPVWDHHQLGFFISPSYCP